MSASEPRRVLPPTTNATGEENELPCSDRRLKTDTVMQNRSQKYEQPQDCSCTVWRILQYGSGEGLRTASTFQWYALCSIMRACRLPDGPRVYCSAESDTIWTGRATGSSFVFKTHTSRVVEHAAADPRMHVFVSERAEMRASGALRQKAAVIQRYDDLVRSGLVVLQDYRRVFALSERKMRHVRAHMKYWKILRQCCGFQQSAVHLARLANSTSLVVGHGDPARDMEELDYPDCEMYDLDRVEALFFATSLSRRYPNALYVDVDRGIKRGWCNATNTAAALGKSLLTANLDATRRACGSGQLTGISCEVLDKVRSLRYGTNVKLDSGEADGSGEAHFTKKDCSPVDAETPWRC